MKPAARHGIRLPNIAKALPPAELTALEDDATYAHQLFEGLDFSAAEHHGLAFDQVVFQRVKFPQTHIRNLRISDCRLERCDCSVADWMNARLRRVELSGCRMLGTVLAEGVLEDVYFQNCLMERANFSWVTFKNARFEKCDLREAAFLGANLKGVVFRNCDLSGADLRDAQMAGADLRGATLDGLKVGAKDLQGAILTAMQALQVVGLLGITIQELDEE